MVSFTVLVVGTGPNRSLALMADSARKTKADTGAAPYPC